MDSNNSAKLKELMIWLNQDFATWKAAEENRLAGQQQETSTLWRIPIVVTEKDYCSRRLGVAYESFNRWKNGNSPISPINVLRIAIATQSPRPLEIFGFDPIPADLWDILVMLPYTSEADKTVIRRTIAGKINAEELMAQYVTAAD